MIKNILKTAFRNYKKNKTIFLINTFGLSLGITACLIIFQYVTFELSYDKFNKNSELLYRIERDPFCGIAPSFVPLLKKNFPDIDKISRITADWSVNIKTGDKTFREDNVCFAEPEIFDILTFKFIKGNPQNALKKGCVVITKSIADKYFGNSNPLGKTLLFDNTQALIVSGVIEDYPENSHLKCNLLGSYLSLRDNSVNLEDDYFLGNNNFSDNVTLAYIKFRKNSNIKNFESKLPSFIDRYIPSQRNNQGMDILASNNIHFTVRKVEDIHLYSHKIDEIKINSDITYIYLFSSLAFLIIIIACINFFNLSTATIDKRSNEIGLKKIFGIKKHNIYIQFIVESIVLITFSTILAIGFNLAILPYLKDFLEISNNFISL